MTDRFRCIAVLIIVKIECLLLGHKLKYADVRFVSKKDIQPSGHAISLAPRFVTKGWLKTRRS
jgi:hypothetical protein